ncbi:hypothetical protein HQ544_02280 [Candidatus Falkowbacteria bacterium]|nr:hypothetical protein [Candidatus Falkowbacteria bacterium]
MQQESELQNVIDLIERTGDKAVVLENGRPAYVLMRLRDYEGLILGKSGVQGLTKDEMQDKINREIAIWKSDQEKLNQLEEEIPEIPDFRDSELVTRDSDVSGVDGWDYEIGDDDPSIRLRAGDEFDKRAEIDEWARHNSWKGDDRAEFDDNPSELDDEDDDDDEFDPPGDVEIPQFETEKDVELPPFDAALGPRPFDGEAGDDEYDVDPSTHSVRSGSPEDEYDVDKEMRNMRKGRDADAPKSRFDPSARPTRSGSSLDSSQGLESRFEEDRFYVEPVE